MPSSRTHAKGDGTTIQRGSQWYAIVPLPAAPDGTRRRWWQKATPNTETGAEQTRRRMLREVATRPRPVTRTRLGDWLDGWLARRAGLRPNTRETEQAAITRMAPLRRHWLDGLTAAHVQAWVDAEATAGYAPRTIRNRLATLRAALTLAVDLDLIARNPASRVRAPRIPHDERPILTEAQARALLALCDDTPYWPVFAVAVALALRQGEALGLRWDAIDLTAGRLTVRRQLQRARGGAVGAKNLNAPLKTPAARRTVLLPAPIVAGLLRHRDRQRLSAGHACDLVCTRRDGEALHPGQVRRVWAGYRATLGAPDVTYHDLRHSAASILAAHGVPATTIMAVLGHTTLTQSASYTHATASGLGDAAAAMGEALDG